MMNTSDCISCPGTGTYIGVPDAGKSGPPKPPFFHFPHSTTHFNPILNPKGPVSAFFRVNTMRFRPDSAQNERFLK
jgi:hypothetical protein